MLINYFRSNKTANILYYKVMFIVIFILLDIFLSVIVSVGLMLTLRLPTIILHPILFLNNPISQPFYVCTLLLYIITSSQLPGKFHKRKDIMALFKRICLYTISIQIIAVLLLYVTLWIAPNGKYMVRLELITRYFGGINTVDWYPLTAAFPAKILKFRPYVIGDVSLSRQLNIFILASLYKGSKLFLGLSIIHY